MISHTIEKEMVFPRPSNAFVFSKFNDRDEIRSHINILIWLSPAEFTVQINFDAFEGCRHDFYDRTQLHFSKAIVEGFIWFDFFSWHFLVPHFVVSNEKSILPIKCRLIHLFEFWCEVFLEFVKQGGNGSIVLKVGEPHFIGVEGKWASKDEFDGIVEQGELMGVHNTYYYR